MVRKMRCAGIGCAALLLMAAAVSGQTASLDGTWQMDSAKSHVRDGRSVTFIIASMDNGIKMTVKTKKGDAESVTEFSTKFNGKASDFAEGDHKSQLTMWWDGTSLNASKEKGPADDVTAMWKFELSPDKQTMTLKISHYEPAADDETLVFNKKPA